MKFIKLTLGALSVYGLVLLFSTPFAGCIKEKIIRDTVLIHDTAHCDNLANGLIGYYNFNNGSLSDSSGLNNHISFNNATKTADRFGKPNNAYLFNGQNNYMTIKNHPSLNPKTFSMVAIVKVNNFYPGKCEVNQLIGKGDNDNISGFYYMRFKDENNDCDVTTPPRTDKQIFYAGYGDITQRTAAHADTSFIQLNKWYTIVYTYDGYESRIYLNGELKKIYLAKAGFTANNFDIRIGGYESIEYPYSFNGVMDEIRFYNKALCIEQVTKLSSRTE